jgi:hypothetical protein
MCQTQLQGATIVFTPNGTDACTIDGVPSACMTLSNVFLGEDPDQPAPTPLGEY